ncbi:C40 family peptidase [Corynebacterium lujinxingii]|uniref:C40 family peptidase n=2 Tax=Corynebacterium lujinxingii TaxID=2763010 RepID=A0A7H0K219_9CORY|nr:NlpC/P60 family protein [Corynebacterium lujinxingii]MBC3178778.1 C40 family peptidase [Corynebacterium lujinxingii]NNO11060.1 hypothetical protein [Corynebacterium lujinxingii]QNP91335.1 C40 family peptidase [Corynebacterium lujinxingii]
MGLVSPSASGQSSTSAVSELVSAVSKAQADVDARNLDLGGLQEAVNQSLVDLHDAQAKAEQARLGEQEAKKRLDDAQARVEKLRTELEELSRSQYRGASASDALTAISGKDTQRDVLDRSLFLRQRSEEKRAKLEEAERARAEAANEEATLRETRELADASAKEAEAAEAEARRLLDDNRAAMEASAAERDAAQRELDAAQSELDEQRAPEGKANEDNATEDSAVASPYAATLTVSRGDATYEVPEEVVDRVRDRISGTSPEAGEPSREAIVDAVRVVAQTSSDSNATADAGEIAALSSAAGLPQLDDDAIAKAGAIAAGVALVGGVAANHGSFADAFRDGGSSELVTAFADGLTGAIGEVEPTSDTVEAVLPELQTAAEISEEAQQASAAVSDSSQVEAVIARAQSMIGTPYVWGGGDANGPTNGLEGSGQSGFDCSGLVLYAFAGAGIALPHYTGYQYQRGTHVPASEAQRGDLLFWGPGGSQHVAIYLGDGTMIEAPQSGQNVKISPVRWSGMTPNAVRLL